MINENISALIGMFVLMPLVGGIVIYLIYGLTKQGPNGPWPFKRPW